MIEQHERTVGMAQLMSLFDMAQCEDIRIIGACDAWLKRTRTLKPMCLLCNNVWSSERSVTDISTQGVNAFFVVLTNMDGEEGQVMISGVCRACCKKHEERTLWLCYEKLVVNFPEMDVKITNQPHMRLQ